MKMKRSFLGIALIVFLLSFVGYVSAATYSLDATDSGWYNPYHDYGNTNYLVGYFSGYEFRNFLVFNLSGISENITSATLDIYCPDAQTPDGSETWTLYDVSTPVATLVAGGTSSSIFDDLGSGTTFGSATVAQNYSGLVTVNLNADAVAALNAAKGSLFAIGGAITTLGGEYDYLNEFLFGDTTNNLRRLTLETEVQPEFRDFMSCNFTCIPSGNDGFKEITVLEVVNQNEHRREGCVEVVLWNGSGHSPIGFKVKLTHYDLDKVNICKMFYDAKRAGLIDEIPKAGALQVRLDSFWLIDLIQNFDLRNFGVNAWTTNYVSSSTFPFRDTDPNLSKMISSNKSNCVMVTTPPEGYSEAPYAYPTPDHWVYPIFVQDTGGPGDESCNYPENNNDPE